MDNLGDLLARYAAEVPDEIAAIKRYIADEFGEPSNVGIQDDALIITVTSASLANTLRLRLPILQVAAKTKKRLIFRIGQ